MAYQTQLVKPANISPGTRTEYLGRASNIGLPGPVTLDEEFGFVAKKFYVGTAGDVVVIGVDGKPAFFPACQPGFVYDHVFIVVASAGTVATRIGVMGGA